MIGILLAFTVVGLLVLIARVLRDEDRLSGLEWKLKQLAQLERRIAHLEESLPADTAEPKPAAPPGMQAPAHAAGQAPATRAAAHTAQPTPSRTREEWEELIGGKLLNRIGALALTIALGSFLKYAFDNNWISESVRVLIGACFGLACLGGGNKAKQQGYEIFAQGLVGAGIAILYLSVYAAFNFYALVPQWIAFVLMACVTVLAFINAMYYDSLAEALLGYAGGFLTPLLLSAGAPNETGLFGYLVLLDAGIIAISLRKEQWRILEPLTLCATWLLYIMWFDKSYTAANLWTTVVFVTLFWMLFLFLDVKRSTSQASNEVLYQIVPGLNASFYFLALYSLLNPELHAWAGLATAAIGAVYAAILYARSRRGGLDDNTKIRYGLTAVWLAVIATAIQFSGFSIVIGWSLEATLLLWLNKHLSLRHLELSAVGLFIIAFLTLCGTENALVTTSFAGYMPIMNTRAAAFALLAVCLRCGSIFLPAPTTDQERLVAAGLKYGWTVCVFILATAETRDFFQRDIDVLTRQSQMGISHESLYRYLNLQQMSISGIWLLYSAVLMGVGLLKKYRELRLAAIALFGISIVKIFIYDLSFLETLYRIFSFLALGVLLLAVSYAYQKYRDVILGNAQT